MRPRSFTLALALGCATTANLASADTMFVSSFLDGTIVRYDLPSATGTVIISGLTLPEDGACSEAGLIYFAESLSDLITRWDQDGLDPTDIIPAAGLIRGPEGLTFDGDGNLFFNTREIGGLTEGAWRIDDADPAIPAVQVVAPFTDFGEGSEIVRAGPHAGGLLLVARAEQQIYISEPPGDPESVLIDSTAFPLFADMFGVLTDGCGDIYVAVRAFSPTDTGVYHFDPEGTFVDIFGGTGLTDVNFMEFDSDGNLYVADESDSEIYKIDQDGTRTLFASQSSAIGVAMCRDRQVLPCGVLTCDAGGPYTAECAGDTTCLELDGSRSMNSRDQPLTYSWTTDCPDGDFGGTETDERPMLCLSSPDCPTECTVTLTVDDGTQTESCTADVLVEDTEAPELMVMLAPAPPRPPRSSSSACSAASSRATFEVQCSASDVCDPDPSIDVTVILTRFEVVAEMCEPVIEELDAACGDLIALELRAPLCPLAPRSASTASSSSSGPAGPAGVDEIRIRATATDRCGNATTIELDPLEPEVPCEGPPESCCPVIGRPEEPPCPVPTCLRTPTRPWR